MVDGIAGTDLYRVLLDRTPEPSAPTPDRWIPEPEPSTLRLTVNALGDMALNPIAQLGLIQATLDTPRRLLLRAAGLARGLATLATALRPATGSSLNGPVSQQCRYRSLSAGLPDVAAAAHRNDVTMNDVLLAAISGGFRDLLLSRQEEPAPHAVRSLVPVSVRAAGDESVRGNQISLLLPYLPVDIADPLERLRAVHSRLAALKASEEAETAEILTHLAEHEPFPLVTYGEWLVFRLPQRQIVTVTTNVPGLQRPAYALGRRMLDIYPYVPIATTVRLGVAVLSYCDRIAIGITGDRDSTADIDLLAGAIHDNLALYNKTTDPA